MLVFVESNSDGLNLPIQREQISSSSRDALIACIPRIIATAIQGLVVEFN